MTIVAPLGIRQKNPGNIRRSPIMWRGKLAGRHGVEFEEFEHELYGIRAMARILLGYHIRKRLYRISEYIGGRGLPGEAGYIPGWAPPTENDTQRYVRNVAAWLSVPADVFYDLTNEAALAALLAAMIRQECGLRPDGQPWYSMLTIREAVALAAMKEVM